MIHQHRRQRERPYVLIQMGDATARMGRRAHTLLLAHEQQPSQTIAMMVQTSAVTVTPMYTRCLTAGLETALYDQARPGSRRILDAR